MNMNILISRTCCEHFKETLYVTLAKIELKYQHCAYVEMRNLRKGTKNLTVIFSRTFFHSSFSLKCLSIYE